MSVHKKQGEELEYTCNGIAESLSFQETFQPQIFLSVPYYITYSVYNSKTDYVYYSNDPLIPRNLPLSEKAKTYFEKNYFTDGDLKILYCSRQFYFFNSVEPVTVIAAIYLDSDYVSKLSVVFPYTFFPFVLILILISFVTSYFNAKRTMQPVLHMTEKVKKISSSNIGTTLQVSSRNDEIDELARTFNSLFLRIKKDFERERQFSSDVSHELKTPLAVINGQTKLLLRWGKDDKAQLETSLNSIAKEAKSMQVIIENLLQISRYESGVLKPEFTKIFVYDLFERLKREFMSIESEVPLKIEIICEKHLELLTDSELLHQIFTVFMSNSLKFCNKAECHITLKASEYGKEIFLSETDNGEGFSETDIPNVFNRFYTSNQARTRNTQKNSTGLGLAIAHTLASVLGGKIKAANNEEGGASLTVELPVSTKT